MEKLSMCRICLAENVRMYIVVNRNLHELYEKLTNIPFVTEDSRPILACFFCCAKLKQCYQLLRQCLEAEELFTQRMKEDYEPNPYQDHVKFCNGFVKSPTVLLCLDDECQSESIDVKEEFPAVCEGLDDVIEPKEELQSEEPEPGILDEICLDVADIPRHHSEPDLEEYDPLTVFKTEVEVEEEEVSQKNGRDTDTQTKCPPGQYEPGPDCAFEVICGLPSAHSARKHYCDCWCNPGTVRDSMTNECVVKCPDIVVGPLGPKLSDE